MSEPSIAEAPPAQAPVCPGPTFIPEQEVAFYQALRKGSTREDAALHAGLRLEDLAWAIALGEQGIAPYGLFLAQVQTMEAKFRGRMVQVITKAASGEGLEQRPNWKAAAFVLERRFPELFGPATEEKVAARVAEMTDQMLAAFSDVLAKHVPEAHREQAIRDLQAAIARTA